MKENNRAKDLAQEKFTSWADNGKVCVGCVFSRGKTPFDDAPSKCSCGVYPYPETKPDSVFLDGENCRYRREK